MLYSIATIFVFGFGAIFDSIAVPHLVRARENKGENGGRACTLDLSSQLVAQWRNKRHFPYRGPAAGSNFCHWFFVGRTKRPGKTGVVLSAVDPGLRAILRSGGPAQDGVAFQSGVCCRNHHRHRVDQIPRFLPRRHSDAAARLRVGIRRWAGTAHRRSGACGAAVPMYRLGTVRDVLRNIGELFMPIRPAD